MRGGEAERREARRGDARLAQGLQRLEEARLYHVNAMLREQRRLTQDLEALRHANSWKKGAQSQGLGPLDPEPTRPAPPYTRAFLPTIPRGSREDERFRHQRLQRLRHSHADGPSPSLQVRVREFMGRGGEGPAEGEGESSTVPLCLPDVNAQNLGRRGSSPLRERRDGERDGERDQDGERDRDRERVKDGGLKVQASPSHVLSLAPDGRLRTVYTLPSFPQALAEARRARYLRYRGRPECERELTLREIFGRPDKDGQPR
ncbi:coiled-coil domain-containing protein 190 [Amia ocellicauda]|uniref:coiled-coil domain-containing protein 190 n=1 Tax=Amia ocellicauda TaxID=2972642 RepID=UPI003464C4B4